MLQLCGVTQRFGERTVLDDLSFEVPPGKVVGLLGPNGAGKTSAMRAVFGVVEPDVGEVRWEGRPVEPADRASWGYMPQARGLYPEMRVRDQLVFLARLRGVAKGEACSRCDALLEQLRLGDRAGDRVDALSGGMQQRVQLAASLIHDPPVVVLDEPFAGNRIDLVEDLCESIVMIHRGREVLAGEVDALKAGSGERLLRLAMEGEPPVHWLDGFAGVQSVERGPGGLRIRLEAGADPLAVLDAARAAGAVVDFCLERPSLSQRFLRAVDDGGADPFGDETAEVVR